MPQSNSTQTIEMPIAAAERTRRTPVAPLTAVSIGNGDQALDLLRRQPVRLGEDGHGRRGEVGEHVDGHAERRDGRPGEEDPAPSEHDEPVRERPADDGVDHAGGLSARGRAAGWRPTPTASRTS